VTASPELHAQGIENKPASSQRAERGGGIWSQKGNPPPPSQWSKVLSYGK